MQTGTKLSSPDMPKAGPGPPAALPCALSFTLANHEYKISNEINAKQHTRVLSGQIILSFTLR